MSAEDLPRGTSGAGGAGDRHRLGRRHFRTPRTRTAAELEQLAVGVGRPPRERMRDLSFGLLALCLLLLIVILLAGRAAEETRDAGAPPPASPVDETVDPTPPHR